MSAINGLIESLRQEAPKLEYAAGRIENDKYVGWVGQKKSHHTTTDVALCLDSTHDRFLLFCLASAWSASGPWENAVALIKTIKNLPPEYSEASSWATGNSTEQMVRDSLHELGEFRSRKEISLRKDIYPAIRNIAKEWTSIERLMADADKAHDWPMFFHNFRRIEGTAPRNTKILIKLPLILRELRCQHVFQNVPGELCCVQDERVVIAIKKLVKENPDDDGVKRLVRYRPTSIETVIRASTRIYELFGDLYDLPLFAAQDLDPK